MRAFKRLTLQHWGWLAFKMTLGVLWPLSILDTVPPALIDSLGWVIYLVCFSTLTGASVSMVGLVMSAQRGVAAVIGLTVELVGLSLMLVGPIANALTQFMLAGVGFDYQGAHYSGPQLLPGAFISLAIFLALINRVLIVLPARRRQASDPGKRVLRW